MKPWWKPYESFLERKPQPAVEVLIDMLAQELCEVCEAFPPAEADVSWLDDKTRARFSGQLEQLPGVDVEMARGLARLIRWDLKNDFEAVDHHLRNGHHKEAFPTAAHEETLHFLWPLMRELLFERKDALQGTLKRHDLLRILDRFDAIFAARHRRIII